MRILAGRRKGRGFFRRRPTVTHPDFQDRKTEIGGDFRSFPEWKMPQTSDTAHSFIFVSPFSNFGEESQVRK